MADKKISQLTAATLPLAGTEVLPLAQTSTKKVAVANLIAGVTVSSGFSTSITGGGTVYVGSTNSFGDLALLKNAAGTTKIGVSNDDGTASSGATFSSYYGGTEIGAFGHYWNGGEFINRIKYFGKQEFAEGTTVRVRIEQTSGDLTAVTGNLVLGTAGKGIDFSANTHAPGMTSELLNWYEEGTWTPTLTPNTSGSITIASPTNSLNYTRIGRLVTLTGRINVSSVSSPLGLLILGGFPFASGPSISNNSGAGAVYADSLTSAAALSMRLAENASAGIIATPNQGDAAPLIQANTSLYINIAYTV
jgi:hypothetical protein